MLCPWADALYAMDRIWWDKYYKQVKAEFSGARFAPLARCYQAMHAPVKTYNNSGAGVISLAHWLGATRVYLLGYDMQHTGGKTHWHGDHPKGLANAGKVALWPAQFVKLKYELPELAIFNCSRVSALECFERLTLEDALREPSYA